MIMGREVIWERYERKETDLFVTEAFRERQNDLVNKENTHKTDGYYRW